MPSPKGGYHLADGTRVPGVTTILSNCNLGSIEGLLGWANKLGKQGKDHKDERDKAANAGTACHEMAECFARGTTFDRGQYPSEILAKADGAYKAFEVWAKHTRLRIVTPECALVSETERYGGTLDAMLIDGLLSIADYKTSNSLRVSMLCQLAAYGRVWNENNPDDLVRGGFHLMRFSRPDHPDDPVHFAHHYWSDLDLAWEAFKHMRRLYDLHARLTKLL